MTYIKIKSLSTLSLASALLLSACGGGSSGGGTTPTPPPPPAPAADTTAPTITLSAGNTSLQSGQQTDLTVSATDNIAVTVGPTVTCTNDGAYNAATGTFTAPIVSAETTSVCTVTASDAAGNEASDTISFTINPDTTDPEASFSPSTLSVEANMTATSVLTVNDNAALAGAATVTCTNGGSFDVSSNVFTAADVSTETESVCTASVTDASGNEGTATLTVNMTAAPVAQNVTVSGTLTYDRVPFPSIARTGLDYLNIVQQPIRQAPVELVNAAGVVVDSTVSDDNGGYSFTVLSGENVRVRVRSEIQRGAPNEIDFKVVDNTSGDAVYALQGTVSEVPTANQTRDLNAGSGWGGTSYTSTRAAAPFALLDTIYGAIEDFIAVDSEVDFPAFLVQWSTRNRAEGGNVADGQIGTSSFTVSNGTPVIRILGDENNDTDEYDAHVVVHEFGHYFENSLSRADSIGGPHTQSDRLDARIAFGEGWGNALSGMILDDPVYRDSSGAAQGRGFGINVENNTHTSTGWYSEASVQSVLYDLFDDRDDGADTASYGLGPIYRTFTDPEYKDTDAFTTIFSFLEALEGQTGVTASEVTALTDAQDINGTNAFGIGETNNGGLADALPVYLLLQTNGRAVEFCSVNNFGSFNKHGNRRYLAMNIPTTGTYSFRMTRASGAATTDPDFRIFKDGVFVGRGESPDVNTETQDIRLESGRHVIDAYAFENIDAGSGLDVCYTMTVEAQ